MSDRQGRDEVIRLLVDAGIDPARDGVRISPVPGLDAPDASFGILAAKALEAGHLDGFWANALGSRGGVPCSS
jgi:NitT/TauT family transport system substrate-binding protein